MRHIRDCFNTKTSQICLQAQQLNKLNLTIQRYIPESFHDHCRVIGFQNGCLILGTNDASWASQLRYLLPELRDQLRAQEKWYQLISIKIIIDMELLNTRPAQQPAKPKKISPWDKILQSLRSTSSNDTPAI